MSAGRRTIFGQLVTNAISTLSETTDDSASRLQREVIERHGKNDKRRVRKTFRVSDHCSAFFIDSRSAIHACKDFGMLFARFYPASRRTRHVATASGENCTVKGLEEIGYAIENKEGEVEIHKLDYFNIPGISENIIYRVTNAMEIQQDHSHIRHGLPCFFITSCFSTNTSIGQSTDV